MGSVLYRPGKSHKVRGVRCELKVIKHKAVKSMLENGWFKSPEDCYKKKEEPLKPPEPKTKPIEVGNTNDAQK